MRRTMFVVALVSLLVVLSTRPPGVVSSRLRVDPETGLYTGFTVKISDQVPRQFCRQTLDKLEVGHLHF